ncbi:E3 ubiquitin ligase PQT3-like [Forsythia ovata]|uniref:E3 ubiquitin ligase PQT3-like n=1 Tax=Forsythia ovata TaxID=205694 RepID=A0ABD1W6C1_9LAMI
MGIQGDHNSYTGVSPHHLMRDCPVVSNPNPMILPGNRTFHGGMPGYPPTYRSGSTLSPLRPYENLFGSPTKMPFNDSMVLMTPFAVPSRIPSLSNALTGHVGIMEAGSTRPPQGNRTARPHGHSVYSELQYSGNKKKCPNENLGREQLSGSEDGVSEKDSRSRVVCDIRGSSSHKNQPSNLERTSSQHSRRYEQHDDSQQMATSSYEYYRDEYGDRKCKRTPNRSLPPFSSTEREEREGERTSTDRFGVENTAKDLNFMRFQMVLEKKVTK